MEKRPGLFGEILRNRDARAEPALPAFAASNVWRIAPLPTTVPMSNPPAELPAVQTTKVAAHACASRLGDIHARRPDVWQLFVRPSYRHERPNMFHKFRQLSFFRVEQDRRYASPPRRPRIIPERA
jgi:hypothetical protein